MPAAAGSHGSSLPLAAMRTSWPTKHPLTSAHTSTEPSTLWWSDMAAEASMQWATAPASLMRCCLPCCGMILLCTAKTRSCGQPAPSWQASTSERVGFGTDWPCCSCSGCFWCCENLCCHKQVCIVPPTLPTQPGPVVSHNCGSACKLTLFHLFICSLIRYP